MGYAYVGTVDTVLKAMETQQKRQPVDWVFCYTYNSLVPHPVLMKSIETFWTKVMPRFRLRDRRSIMGLLSDKEAARLAPASAADSPTPVPMRVVSSDEFLPIAQTERQKQVEARMNALGDEYGRRNGLSRRRFFQTAAGMTTAFVAMNEVYGPIYGASPAEAKSVDLAQARADGLKDQFIMDVHTHFLRDDTRLEGFVRGREAVGKAGWNPDLVDKPQTIEDLKYPNWFKEIYLDSDTKVALISGSPSEEPRDWFLTNDMKLDARTKVNTAAGSRRCLSHAIFTPGYPGLDGRGRSRHRDAQARFVEGLHGRRQHPQGAGDASVAHGRREADLSVLREDRQGGPRHRLRPQGPLSAVGRAALPASHALRRRRRCRQGGQGLAQHPLRHLPLGLSLDRRRRRAGQGRLCAVRADRPGRMDQRPRRHPGASTASATSTAISARSSPRPRSSSRASAPR